MNMLSFTDKSKRVDTVIITVAAIFLFASGLLILDDRFLFQNLMVQKQRIQENPVATLTQASNDVRKKLPGDLVWIPVSGNQRVVENETIFTGPDSTVLVKFDDGTEFTLEPDSMVIIQKQADKANINIALGGITGKLGKNVKLKANGNDDFELSSDSGAEINLNVSADKGPKVDILSGNADFNTIDGKQQLAQNQTIELEKGKIANIRQHQIKLTAPLVNQRIIMSPKEKVTFSWKALIAADEFQFEFSTHRDFTENFFKKKTKDLDFVLPRPKKEGDYFWRVKLYKASQLISESLPRKIIIVHEKPPTLILPNDNEVLEYPYLVKYLDSPKTAMFDVNFKWDYVLDINKTQIQFARDKKFKEIVADESSDVTFLKKQLPPGKYYWRARIQDKKVELRTWSDVGSFKIQLNNADLKPKLIHPINKNKLIQYDFSLLIGFEWEKLENVKEYRIEIASKKDFSDDSVLLIDATENNTFEWETKDKKKFYWRVRAITDEGVLTHYSEIEEFLVEDPPPPKPPELKENEVKKEFSINKIFHFLYNLIIPSAYAEEPLTDVKLEWEEVERAVKYKIEISPTRSFKKNLLEKEVKKTKFIWQHDQAGNYYWRVRAIDKKDIIGEVSKTGIIKLRFNQPKPIIVNSYQEEITQENQNKKKLSVKLSWEKDKIASFYQVQISDDPNFSNASLIKTQEDHINYEIPFLNEYHWRVRSLDKVGRIASDFCDSITIVAQPIISELEVKLEKPIKLFRYRYSEDSTPAIKLSWQPVSHVSEYLLEIAQDSSFDKIILNQKVKKNSYDFEAKAPLRPHFYWRVRALNPYSQTDWSEKRRFIIISNENLDVPEMIYPSSNTFAGKNEFDEVYFEWSPVTEALSYIIEIGVDKDFKFGKKIYLASNPKARIKLKTRSTYFYRIRSTFIIPHDENVSELRVVPQKAIGKPSEVFSFNLNKGYTGQLEMELGVSDFSFTNNVETPTANIIKGTAKSAGFSGLISYKWYPKAFSGNWGFGFGHERGSAQMLFVDENGTNLGDFHFETQDTRAILSYRTSFGRNTSFETNMGFSYSRRAYPFLVSGIYESKLTQHTYYEQEFVLRLYSKKVLYHLLGLKLTQNLTNSGDAFTYMPWYELRYYKENIWYGFKLKYHAQEVGYGFDENYPQNDKFQINATSVAFTTGIGF